MSGEPIIVLLIEDNEDHAELAIRNLSRHRVANRVIHLADGEAALDYFLRRGPYQDPAASPVPHVILLDLRLPKVDGLQVLHFLKFSQEFSQIPVIVLTSSAAERDVATAYSSHANSYLVKPLDFEQFAALMSDLGFYWLLWNQRPNSDSSPHLT